MKSKRISTFFILTVAVLTLTLPGMAAEVESIYGHVSFVENQATITRIDQAEHKVVVNLPLVPGDTIVTSTDGRCELQFDNGTVIRLDKNSSLRITTVQAPTLTSRWKITTLHLLQGQMYTLPQTYNMEMFQIITPNAAVKLKSRTAATIRFDDDLSTTLFSDAGKYEVLYGADSKTLKKVKVKAGQAYVIDAANTLVVNHEKRNLEFVAWNEYVDRHFKELHYGINKVPPKLKFGNNALRYWAEKWSSLVGEWIYDELFGYVWKPADDRFAYSARPFFHADSVRINGQLFLVPQEAWAWVPAHMGTWVWLKRGWTWIPGSWFHSDVGYFFHNYFNYAYGDYDLYNIYRREGIKSWRKHCYLKFHRHHKKPPVKDLPRELQKIIKRINKVPFTVIAERLKAGQRLSESEVKKVPLQVLSPKADVSDKVSNKVAPASGKAFISKSLTLDRSLSTKDRTETNGELKNVTGRDWNPDNRLAVELGFSINYSSSRNVVVCPELHISSDQKHVLNRVGSNGLFISGQGYISGNSSQSSTTGTVGDSSAIKTTTPSDSSKKKDDSGK